MAGLTADNRPRGIACILRQRRQFVAQDNRHQRHIAEEDEHPGRVWRERTDPGAQAGGHPFLPIGGSDNPAGQAIKGSRDRGKVCSRNHHDFGKATFADSFSGATDQRCTGKGREQLAAPEPATRTRGQHQR